MNYEERKAVFERALTEYGPRCRNLAVWLGEHPEISRQEKESRGEALRERRRR